MRCSKYTAEYSLTAEGGRPFAVICFYCHARQPYGIIYKNTTERVAEMIKLSSPEELAMLKETLGEELYMQIAACRRICIPVREGYFLLFSLLDLKNDKEKEEPVYLYCSKKDAFFFTRSPRCRKILKDGEKQENPLLCVARFFTALTAEDIDGLERLEAEIETLEDLLLTARKPADHAEKKIIQIRKRLLRLKRYYEQLGMILGELTEDDAEIFDKETRRQLRFADRHVSHLLDSVFHLREYITQVREAYQAQIEIEQNQVMKVFTVITTVFLPLTLIAGWYGMNFAAIPELEWRYGYLYVILLSVFVCSLCILFFKHKKWF